VQRPGSKACKRPIPHRRSHTPSRPPHTKPACLRTGLIRPTPWRTPRDLPVSGYDLKRGGTPPAKSNARTVTGNALCVRRARRWAVSRAHWFVSAAQGCPEPPATRYTGAMSGIHAMAAFERSPCSPCQLWAQCVALHAPLGWAPPLGGPSASCFAEVWCRRLLCMYPEAPGGLGAGVGCSRGAWRTLEMRAGHGQGTVVRPDLAHVCGGAGERGEKSNKQIYD